MIEIPNQQEIINFYGPKMQCIIAMEECAELIQAISKLQRFIVKRGSKKWDNIVEEIADVLICIEQLKLMYCITDKDIQGFIDFKVERQVKRMDLFEGVMNNTDTYIG